MENTTAQATSALDQRYTDERMQDLARCLYRARLHIAALVRTSALDPRALAMIQALEAEVKP